VLVEDVREFGDRLADLPPQTAARDWLSLADRAYAFQKLNGGSGPFSQFSDLLKYLPAPTSWPYIERSITVDSERNRCLLLLLSVLQGKSSESLKRLADLQQDANYWLAKGGYLSDGSASTEELLDLKLELAVRRRDSDAIVSILKSKADLRKRADHPRENDFAWFKVPDLVPLLGVRRAREVLAYILTTAKAELQDGSDRATTDLARDVAMRLTSRLAAPQWMLSASTKAGDLFEQFKDRDSFEGQQMDQFGAPSFYGSAAMYCLANLVSSGQLKRARKFEIQYANNLQFEPFGRDQTKFVDELAQTGKLEPFIAFFGEVSSGHPETQLSQTYLSLQKFLPRPNRERALKRFLKLHVAGSPRENAENDLGRLYLSEGKLPEALTVLTGEKSGSPEQGLAPNLYLLLGKELRRPDLIKRGLELAEKSMSSDFDADDSLLPLLIQNGFGPGVEEILIDGLRKAEHPQGMSSPPQTQLAVEALTRFYFQAGRYRDVVTLLEEYPNWCAPDLGDLGDYGEPTWAYIAAKSLAQIGRGDEAAAMLPSALKSDPRDDGAYALLISLDRALAAKTFDALHSELPCEPRPLMWKASLLSRSGRAREAELTVRQAIALDPDDTENATGPHRFAAYRLLATIERSLGNLQSARRLDAYELAADRVSKAVEYDGVDMYQKAIACYRQALAAVPDDFRTRLQLADDEFQFGDAAEGKADFSRAFRSPPRRMSDSIIDVDFDRLAGPSISRMAYPVLEDLAHHGSGNPINYVLLGDIYRQRGEPGRALEVYRRAVQIDPDCGLAWIGLSLLTDKVPPEICNEINTNLLRLGPYLRGSWPPFAPVYDYGKFWEAAEATLHRKIRASRLKFDLRASHRKLATFASSSYLQSLDSPQEDRDSGLPAAPIAQDALIQKLCDLIDRAQR
jgi:tetratricopeptide (TPR) repeat protein